MKPKVLVCVLTGLERQNWLNPDLAMNLLQAARDPRYEVDFCPIRDARPWETARNQSIMAARSVAASWLVSFDNDNFVYCNPLDVIAAATERQRIVGLTYGVGGGRDNQQRPQYALFPASGHGATDGPFREETSVGGGVLAIHRSVWDRIRGPWFRWQHADNETLSPEDGKTWGEDTFFCRLVQQHGFRVWTSTQVFAGHYRTSDITSIACSLPRQPQPTFNLGNLIVGAR